MIEHLFYRENAPPSVVVLRDCKPQPMVVYFHDLALEPTAATDTRWVSLKRFVSATRANYLFKG